MKAIATLKKMAVVAALPALLFPAYAQAATVAGKQGKQGKSAPQAAVCEKKNYLKEFLAAQGTTSNFFPPFGDYVGWVDKDVKYFALVDYAGIANRDLKIGTTVKGSVRKCTLPNGATQVYVNLLADKAMGFAQTIDALSNNGFDFNATPAFFGAKAADVKNRKTAATGPAAFSATFVMPNAAPNFPNLIDVVVDNPGNYKPVTLAFTSSTDGKCANGKDGNMFVHQVGATDAAGALVFTQETVDITGCE
jgi:hypothetical protein